MAQTGKLGAADSLLGNLLPAFAGADDVLPSTDPRTGVLGTSDALLAQIILDLSGPDNPKVFNLWAANTLVLTQLAESGAELKGHTSADWVLGGHDSRLGDNELGFSGPDDPLPATGTRSGKLGLALGSIVIGLVGVETGKVFNVSAQTTLTIVQSAESGAELKGHPSARWVLGGQDSYLGNAELAYVPVDLLPTTGTLTGKLGSASSGLANMRLALGELEGDSGGATYTVAAESTLTLSSSAALTNFSRSISASSTIVLTSVGETSAVRPVAGISVLSLSDLASAPVARSVSAENTLGLSVTAALFPWTITEVSATSSLSLTGVATGRHARFYPVAESVLELTQVADSSGKFITEVVASSAIALTSEATGRHARFFPEAESALDLVVSAESRYARFWPAATSTLSLSSSASSRFSRFWPTATSTLDLSGTASGWNPVTQVSATSTLGLTQDASAALFHTYSISADSSLDFFQFAFGRHSHFRSVSSSTLALTDAVGLTKTLGISAESLLQVIDEQYDPVLDEIAVTIEGLQDSAQGSRVSAQHAKSIVPLRHRAGGYALRSDAIGASAESTIVLTDQSWNNVVGEAASHIGLSQSAIVQRANPTISQITLTDSAGVTVARKRTASSVLELKQAVTYSLIRPDVVFIYRPFIGEGPVGAPTPPPATL